MSTLDIRPGYFGHGSVEVTTALHGEGGIRRLAIASGKLLTQPFEGINTVPDVVDYAARNYGTLKAVGWREVVKVHEEKKQVRTVVDGKEVTEEKTWKFFELSDYKFLNYLEFKEAVTEIARAFLVLGITSEDVFNIYAQTR